MVKAMTEENYCPKKLIIKSMNEKYIILKHYLLKELTAIYGVDTRLKNG
jgi:hypothetical protein